MKDLQQDFIESLKGKSDYQLQELLFQYSETGDLERVKSLLSYYNIDAEDTSGALSCACLSGNIELVKYFLVSPNLKNLFDINSNFDSALSSACQTGHLHIVKYLLESPELEKHSHIPFINGSVNNPIVISASIKHLDMFEYLISISKEKDIRLVDHISKASSKAASHNDLNFIKNFIEIGKKHNDEIISSMLEGIIYGACYENNVDILKYIFKSQELSKHVDIHKDDDSIFRLLLIKSRKDKPLDVLQYFIFDLNIEETENIKKARSTYKREFVEKMFELRQFNQTLNNDLTINQNKHKQFKI